MPRIDFWNNPLIVSAFRVKYRRSAPTLTAMIYFLALVGLGSLFFRFREEAGPAWVVNYFVTVMSIQFFASVLVPVITTSNGLYSEVVQRTLDAQRIAAISPAQIVLGKLLGESSVNFFMIPSTIPITVACYWMGAVRVPVVVLLYVQLVTVALMFGCFGLIQPLELPTTKAGVPPRRVGPGAGLALLAFFAIPTIATNAGNLAASPWASALFGSISPILSLYGLATGDVWRFQLAFYHVHIPYLLVAPAVQAAIAAICFRAVTRALTWPHLPAVSKPQAYGIVLLADIVAGGVAFRWAQLSLATSVVFYWSMHLAACLLLVAAVTPDREAVRSWVWRFRGRHGWLRDWMLHDRTETRGLLLSFGLLGFVCLGLCVLLPHAIRSGGPPLGEAFGPIVVMGLLIWLLVVSIGTLYQWCLMVASRPSKMVFLVGMVVLVLTPTLVGAHLDSDPIRATSPLSQYVQWSQDPSDPLPWLPLAGLYGTMLVSAWMDVGRRLRRSIGGVEAKLRAMGVPDH